MSKQSACAECESESEGKYYDFCHIVRSWRNHIGFKMGGLLIDTLTYDFFEDNDFFVGDSSKNYLEILKDLFAFLKNQDKNRSYWYAMGSNQCVYNSDNGKFVGKAKKAYNKIKNLTIESEEANKILRQVLGNAFPKAEGKILSVKILGSEVRAELASLSSAINLSCKAPNITRSPSENCPLYFSLILSSISSNVLFCLFPCTPCFLDGTY